MKTKKDWFGKKAAGKIEDDVVLKTFCFVKVLEFNMCLQGNQISFGASLNTLNSILSEV